MADLYFILNSFPLYVNWNAIIKKLSVMLNLDS